MYRLGFEYKTAYYMPQNDGKNFNFQSIICCIMYSYTRGSQIMVLAV